MPVSVFDLFTIGIGPSSSHSVGPMRAACRFVSELETLGLIDSVHFLRVELYGSLALTGIGHGTDKAILMGLEGETPEAIDPQSINHRVETIRKTKRLQLYGRVSIPFDPEVDLIFQRNETLPFHSNGISFSASDKSGKESFQKTFYSIGGGFVVTEKEANENNAQQTSHAKHSFNSGTELLEIAEKTGLSISEIVLENEKEMRTEEDIQNKLLDIWHAMQASVKTGCETAGTLPGGLKITRRAPELYCDLCSQQEASIRDSLATLDWVNLYALAVNEENAAGGRVVTAPTNGAAGIIPAVLHYYERFTPHANEKGICRFLLTAAAIAMLYKKNASISGAEVGCQGEIGVACSMAAGALTEVLGGTPQ
ncbi:L-serine dehydratase, beta subunit / L-serine dehydratase, alpha subunit, partial [hydrothermal vent metagenome]